MFQRALATGLGISLGLVLSFVYGVLPYSVLLLFAVKCILASTVMFIPLYYLVFLTSERRYREDVAVAEYSENT